MPKKRVDAKSDAAFLSNHLPPLVYSLRFQTHATTDANYAQTNSPHNSAPMDGANFHLPLISSGESETAAIPTSLSVQRHNDRGEESEAAPHTYFGPMDGELSEGGRIDWTIQWRTMAAASNLPRKGRKMTSPLCRQRHRRQRSRFEVTTSLPVLPSVGRPMAPNSERK